MFKVIHFVSPHHPQVVRGEGKGHRGLAEVTQSSEGVAEIL